MTAIEEQILNFLINWADGHLGSLGLELATDDDTTTFGDLVKRLHAERNAKSWIFEVHGVNNPKDKFTTNALRFDTEEAAKGYGYNLSMRWFGFDDSRVSPSPDEATHSWNEETQSTIDLRDNTEYHAPEKVKL